MAIKKELNILILMLVLVVSLNLTSALFDWNQYGSEFTTSPEIQQNAFGTFNLGGITKQTYINGQTNMYNTITEPLTSTMGSENNVFTIYQNGNYLEFLDKNQNLVAEKFMGIGLYDPMQIGGQFEGGTSTTNDIAGIWKINATYMNFYVMRFNPITFAVNVITSLNFTLGGVADYSNGVKCVSGGDSAHQYCNTIITVFNGTNYQYNYFRFYGNRSTEGFQIANNGDSIPTEPLSYADANNDGLNEYLFASNSNAYMFNENGVLLTTIPVYKPSSTQNARITNVRFFKSDTTNNYRIFMLSKSLDQFDSNFCYVTGTVYRNCLWDSAYRADGSLLWSSASPPLEFSTTGGTKDVTNPSIMDYNQNGIDDIFFATNSNLYILKGSDGSQTYTKAVPIGLSTETTYNKNYKGAVAFMGGNQLFPSFIVADGLSGKAFIYSPKTNTTYWNDTLSTKLSCDPTDINYNGFLELVCQSNTNTYYILTNATNHLPTISSISYSPSTTITTTQTLTVTTNATDQDGDVIVYAGDCGNGVTIAQNFINHFNCNYGTGGTYNVTSFVTDGFHLTTNNSFSQIITVNNPTVCNFNAICEVGLGENVNTCPSDCTVNNQSVNPVSNQSQLGNINTITVPSQLVDTSSPDSNNGILPEIYFGMINFLSHSLSPLILIVFIIFSVLIMLAIGLIIKKIFIKVSDMK